MKIFVSGASGFVGGAICKALRAEHEIVAMARSDKSAAKIEALGVKAIRCELGSVEIEHMINCEVVIHSAAFVEQWGSQAQFWQTNVVGTQQLLACAKAAGVKRFIHISSEAVFFRGEALVDIDEEQTYAFDSPFLYPSTKAHAEQSVLAANDPDGGFTTIALRPRLIWGPGDQTILAGVLEMVNKGAFFWFDEGRFETSSTHIHNLVEGVRLSLTTECNGEAYFILDDERSTMKEFLTRYLLTQSINLPDRSLSAGMMRWIARRIEFIWRILKLQSTPPLTEYAVAVMSNECTLKGNKAREQLNYKPVLSLADGFRQMPKS